MTITPAHDIICWITPAEVVFVEFHWLYRPLTAHPFQNTALYREVPPNPALAPWVRCFWGTDRPVTQEPERTLVTPDTCMDLILEIRQAGAPVTCRFCGINDRPFESVSPGGQLGSIFGVRFYPWALALFCEDSLANSKNKIFPGESLFPRLCRELVPVMEAHPTLEGRAQAAGALLLSRLRLDRCSEPLLQASWELLRSRGSLRMEQLSRSLHVSTRQLERLFQTHMGLSPKTFACLMRYQLLWCDALRPGFDIQDAVFRYGFTDQSHLLHDFKKFHTMTLPQAQARAWKDVGFLQEKSGAER